MLFTSLDFVIFEFGFRYSRVGIFVFTSLDFGFYKLGFCAIGRLKSCLVPTKLNFSRDITASFSLFSFISLHFPVLPAPSRHVHNPLRTNSSPLAYKSTATNIVFLRPGLTNSSPLAYKTIASDVQTSRPTDKNFFSGTEIYFKGLEIYFKASEIHFQAFEIVLSQAVMDFVPQSDGKCPSRSASFIPAGQEESPGRCARGFHHSLP